MLSCCRAMEMKNHRGLTHANVTRSAVSASWQFGKLGFYLPPETPATIFLRIPLPKNGFETLEKSVPEL